MTQPMMPLLLILMVACADVGSRDTAEAPVADLDDAGAPPPAAVSKAVDAVAGPPPATLDDVNIDPTFEFRATRAVSLDLAVESGTPLLVRLGGRVVFRGVIPAGGQTLRWPIPLHASALELEWRNEDGSTSLRTVALPPAGDDGVVALEEVL